MADESATTLSLHPAQVQRAELLAQADAIERIRVRGNVFAFAIMGGNADADARCAHEPEPGDGC